jgi:hypothetical protein
MDPGEGQPDDCLIVLTLRPLPSDRPAAVRLRLILKDILRRAQFRCVGLSGALPPDLPPIEENQRAEP